MSLSDIRKPRSVLKAVAEFDRLGRDTFLRKYGFRRSRGYFLKIGDQTYDTPGPLRIKAVMKADGARMSIREATIDGKALKARVAASLDSSRAIKRFDVDVELIEADLNAYLPPQMGGRKNVPARAGRGAASKRAPPSGWSETPFDLSPLRQADGQAKVKIGRVRYGEVEFEKGTATVNLTGGKLTAVLENLIIAGGTAKLSATVDGTQRIPASI